jgi:hypothetical protein
LASSQQMRALTLAAFSAVMTPSRAAGKTTVASSMRGASLLVGSASGKPWRLPVLSRSPLRGPSRRMTTLPCIPPLRCTEVAKDIEATGASQFEFGKGIHFPRCVFAP